MEPSSCTEHALPPLQQADIILVRHKKGVFRRYLRKVLASEWDHTALVVYPRTADGEVGHTIIAEAAGAKRRLGKSQGTVALHRLDKYHARPDLYAVGVRRVPGLTAEEKERVMLYMIANVDAPYWPWNEPMVVLASYSKRIREWVRNTQRYSCSSLIQKAFYDAVIWTDRKKIVFKADTVTPLVLQELTSPGDFGATDKLEWIHDPFRV